jgi:NDP-sugar pyrophosphorylase family protein
MIIRVLENLDICFSNYIFVIRKEHQEEISKVLKPYNSIIITTEKPTEGAACTCLLAKEYLKKEESLVVANCDQIMNFDKKEFLELVTKNINYIFTFKSTSPKNSFAQLDKSGNVIRVAEKKVISNIATCGVYYFSKARFMIDACEQMIKKNIRTNNEFYLCPCYNEIISNNFVVKTIPVKEHYPIGTPEDLEEYVKNSNLHIRSTENI